MALDADLLKLIHGPFIKALLQNIKERLPDTELFANFKVFDPQRLPDSVEAISSSRYGFQEMKDFAGFYGVGDLPVVDPDELQSEWLNFRVYMLTNYVKMSTSELFSLLASQSSTTASVYPS